jgi:hypothetical protein
MGSSTSEKAQRMTFRAKRNRILHGLALVVALTGLTALLRTDSFSTAPSHDAGNRSLPVVAGFRCPARAGEPAVRDEPTPTGRDRIERTAAVAPAPTNSCRPGDVARRPSPAKRGSESGSPAASARPGFVVAIDPETGMLGPPSPEQAHAIASATRLSASRSPDGLIEIHRPDGAVGIDLQGRFRDYAIVRMGADGRPVLGCLQGDRRHVPTLADTLSGAPALEEK